jgi:hypothetical protein
MVSEKMILDKKMVITPQNLSYSALAHKYFFSTYVSIPVIPIN